jgi:hypothetical protein
MRPGRATIRHAAGRLLVFIAAIAAAFSAVTLISGGFVLRAGSFFLSSRDPVRPLLVAAALFVAARLLLSSTEFRAAAQVITGDRSRLATRMAGAAAAGALVFSIAWTSRAAGGSDSSCYVLQAEAFAQGRVTLSNGAAPALPDAPSAAFAPTGFVPSRSRPSEAVPICGPGLALLMAGAFVIHRDAVFLVVPVFAGLLVWLTFVFGRQVDDQVTGAAAAVLAACSPIFLYQAVQPMTDVPAAALWLAALTLASGARRRDTIAAGVCASLTILIRPNMALLLIPLVFLLFRLKPETSSSAEFRLKADTSSSAEFRLKAETTESTAESETTRSREDADTTRSRAEAPHINPVVSAFRRNLLFVAAMVPGVVLLLALNAARYGSPLASGYGDTGTLFSAAHLAPNAARYSRWLLETHTPFVLLALAAPWVIPRAGGRRRLALAALAGSALIVATYLAYTVFDDWWYTRFLLPAIPILLALSVAIVLNMTEWLPPLGGRFRGRSLRAPAAVILCAALGGWYLHVGRARQVLDLQSLESRFVIAGRYAARALPANAVILSVQQSGSLRFHGGRDTIAWDGIPPDALDRTIATIGRAGRVPFIVLEDAEEPVFRQRFATERFGRLGWPPSAVVHAPVRVHFYDPAALERFLAGQRVDTEHVR